MTYTLLRIHHTKRCEILAAAALPTHFGSVSPKGEHVAAEGRLQLSFLEKVVLHHLPGVQNAG